MVKEVQESELQPELEHFLMLFYVVIFKGFVSRVCWQEKGGEIQEGSQ